MSEHWSMQRREASAGKFVSRRSLKGQFVSDAARIMGCLNDPAAEKWVGASSQRQVITPGPERGLVSTVGPDGLFCANTVGAFGVVSAGQNLDRLVSAGHRWDLKLGDA